jgi:hypothetical protein
MTQINDPPGGACYPPPRGNVRRPPVPLPVSSQPRAGQMPHQLAALIGLRDISIRSEPVVMLDWALDWAKKGMHIFPCRRWLGIPLVERWYRLATTDSTQIVEWWSQFPNADIGAVPNKSQHFVIVAQDDDGAESLAELEERYGQFATAFRYTTRTDCNEHLWIKGAAVTSHHKVGRGLHVLGEGNFVYLPASLAPDPFWSSEGQNA